MDFLHILFVSTLVLCSIAQNETYDYIVIGSGPGGGPLAANLARAGQTVLLLEAGDDHGDNANNTLIYNAINATNDPGTRWDFFVEQTHDVNRQNRYLYQVWKNKDNSFYVGRTPTQDARRLGVWYPRSATLGGCAMHNQALAVVPNDAYWNYIAELTGDDSWNANEMHKHFQKLERNLYLPKGSPGHGFDGWLNISRASTGSPNDSLLKLAIEAAGGDTLRDINDAADPNRDQTTGVFGSTTHSNVHGVRSSPNNYIKATLKHASQYPLTVRLNALASKVLFSKDTEIPVAIGVEYMIGRHLYNADPRSNPKDKGTVRHAFSNKEVIVSGGVFNTPQILKLSGIGPADELKKFGIPVIQGLPGVGHRVSDNYEGGLVALASNTTKDTTKFHLLLKSSSTQNARNVYLWCGAFSFEGFWPGFPNNHGPNQYECAFSQMNPHNQQGSVILRTANPRDTPKISLGFFETGAEDDLDIMLDTVKWARENILNRAPQNLAPFHELHPCTKADCTDQDQKNYLRDQVYSHHATGSCSVGAHNDIMSVLDSKFRVQGVKKLRVVDGSVFPKAPGAFPVLPTFIISQKATSDILNGEM